MMKHRPFRFRSDMIIQSTTGFMNFSNYQDILITVLTILIMLGLALMLLFASPPEYTEKQWPFISFEDQYKQKHG